MFQATDFYPTPRSIALQMVAVLFEGRQYKDEAILDPSAGKGDLLDVCPKYQWKKDGRVAIEIDPDLQATLKGKGYRLIGTDFLTFNEPCAYPYIIMNPPFSQGIQHLFKAWETLAEGGRLVCLLPETVANESNRTKIRFRELLQQYGGRSEDLGPCFKDAERPTDVGILMVVLDKPKRQQAFDFTGFEYKAEDFEAAIAESTTAGIARRDVVAALVHQYELAYDALKERHTAQERLNFALSGIAPRFRDLGGNKEIDLTKTEVFSDEVQELKQRFWQTVFDKTELKDRATSDFEKKFEEWARDQVSMAFNEANVKQMLMMFWQNKAQIDLDSLCHVFDELTKYHEKNIVAYKGWKTNKAARINKKIIIPYVLNQWGYVNYNKSTLLDDIDKACCIVTGKVFADIEKARQSTYRVINDEYKEKGLGEKYQSEFFEIRVFKIGTAHLTFRDLRVVDEINKTVVKHRQWIGPDY